MAEATTVSAGRDIKVVETVTEEDDSNDDVIESPQEQENHDVIDNKQGSGEFSFYANSWTLVNPSEFPQKVLEVQESFHKTLVRKWREAITGDPDKRIRDSLTESKVRTRVKQVDSLSFTVGVAFSYLVQFIALKRPDLFSQLYIVSMAVLLPHRYFTYRSTNDQYFMMDFCYWVNTSLILQQMFCSCGEDFCATWFQINYILIAGPLSAAVVLWGNSLVFHSIDKVTSFSIHIMPAILVYVTRWDPKYVSPESTEVCYPNQDLSLYTGFLIPVGCWWLWQLFYLYVQFSYLDFHPELTTSQRYLTEQALRKGQGMGVSWGKFLGLFKEGQDVHPDDINSTISFVSLSAVILTSTMLQAPILYYSSTLNLLFMIVMIWSAIWNGGTYYIHIFSSRYNKKFPARRSSIALFNKDE